MGLQSDRNGLVETVGSKTFADDGEDHGQLVDNKSFGAEVVTLVEHVTAFKSRVMDVSQV